MLPDGQIPLLQARRMSPSDCLSHLTIEQVLNIQATIWKLERKWALSRSSSPTGMKALELSLMLLSRIIKEMATYFGAFAKMQDVLTAATTQLAAATKERAKEFYATKMKFDIDITNPLILVPRGTNSEDYLYLDLGRIIVSNTINPAGEELVDTMKIKVVKLNLQTFQEDFSSVLFLHTDISVGLSRPISQNEGHVVPDLAVSAARKHLTNKLD